MLKKLFSINAIFLILSGCASLQHNDVLDTKPGVERHNLFIQQFFDGEIVAYGLVLNRDQKSKRQFKRVIKGVWKNDDGFMSEHVYYTDGSQARREWCIHIIDDNHFTGVSTNVVGVIQGEQYENHIHMVYHPAQDIYLADNLHSQGQLFASYRSLPIQNIYSLLTLSTWYGGLKAAAALERGTIKPALKNTITYTYKDIGPFCQRVSKDWNQHLSESILIDNVWMYKVSKNMVMEKVDISEHNFQIGEVIATLQR